MRRGEGSRRRNAGSRELPLRLAEGGQSSVVKEGAIGESFKFKMFLRESQGMMPVTLSESSLGVS